MSITRGGRANTRSDTMIGRRKTAPIEQGAEMRPAFMSIETVSTYSEGMTHGTENAELGDPGARRRR